MTVWQKEKVMIMLKQKQVIAEDGKIEFLTKHRKKPGIISLSNWIHSCNNKTTATNTKSMWGLWEHTHIVTLFYWNKNQILVLGFLVIYHFSYNVYFNSDCCIIFLNINSIVLRVVGNSKIWTCNNSFSGNEWLSFCTGGSE